MQIDELNLNDLDLSNYSIELNVIDIKNDRKVVSKTNLESLQELKKLYDIDGMWEILARALSELNQAK